MSPGRRASSAATRGGRFATTRWSLVLAAGGAEPTAARDALAALCALYWYPVFAFVRRRGHSPDEAQDLTQAFFARLIEKDDLRDADRSRGRFRSFLLSACQHFLLNERDRTMAVKRGGGQWPVPIDAASAESRYQKALSHAETPEHLFARQWCLTLLGQVLDDLGKEYAASGRKALFDRLEPFLAQDEDAGTHASAAEDLCMTPAAVKMAVHRLRRRYRERLWQAVADTVESDQDVEGEILQLHKTLSDRAGGV